VDDAGEGIHRLAVDQDVQLDQVGLGITGEVIVHGGIPAADRFEPVVKINDDLVERQIVGEHDPLLAHVLKTALRAAFFLKQTEDAAEVFVGRHDDGGVDRLLDPVNVAGRRQMGGIFDEQLLARPADDAVTYAGCGGDQVELELPLQPALDDVHVQQAEKAATKAEAQGGGGFGIEPEGAVVELEFP